IVNRQRLRVSRCVLAGRTDRGRDLCQPKVENLRLNSIRNEDVCGLDVPVDDAFRVCGIEGIGDLDAQIKYRFDFQRLATDPMPECLTLQPFHCDEASPNGLVDFVDRSDVRVVQCGCGLRLALETGQGLSVSGNLLRQELQGHETMEPDIFGLVNDTDAATAQLIQDAVVRTGLAEHRVVPSYS